jgi:serine/threonine-protein kinase
MTINSGQILRQRYRIVSLLASGGMGSVYRAWDLNLKIPVALKENLSSEPIAERQFEHEATILANLTHPHLPHVTDYFSLPGEGQYLIMDFIDGEDLQCMVERLGALSQMQVLPWIDQVCLALDYLHNQPRPVIHRDIKPANIKIRSDGRAMLVDFGIAKIFSPDKGTTTGAKAVTPGYSPPEQYSGRTDARSDIYSLGATLYFLLTGNVPPESALRAVGSEPFLPPRQINPDISPTVEMAILKALQIPTEQRYQKISHLRQALAQAQPAVLIAQPSVPISAPLEPTAQLTPSLQPDLASQAAQSSTAQVTSAPSVANQSTPYLEAPAPTSARSLSSPGYRPASHPAAWKWLAGGTVMVALLIISTGLILLATGQLPIQKPTPTSLSVAMLTRPANPTQTASQPTAAPKQPSQTPAQVLSLPSPTQKPPTSRPPTSTSIPRPSATATSAPPTLYLDKGYNCRGGPDDGYEIVWTFEAGITLEIIGKEPTGEWWLIRINDPRTRGQQCWIGGGIPNGDLASVPISDWTGTRDSAKVRWP